MPYTTQKDREKVWPVLRELEHRLAFFLSTCGPKWSEYIIDGLYYVLSRFIRDLEAPVETCLGPSQKAESIFREVDGTPGDLNYLICSLVWRNLLKDNMSYTNLDAVIDILETIKSASEEHEGTLACASMEIYRRLGVRYEEKKISENGDVFI